MRAVEAHGRAPRRQIPLLTLIILLLGIGLRVHALAQDIRLEPDEAWFSTFAREAAINGGWWLPGPLDKTPLAIYANALAQVFVGNSDFAARLPGFFASILLMPVMLAAARAWYGQVRCMARIHKQHRHLTPKSPLHRWRVDFTKRMPTALLPLSDSGGEVSVTGQHRVASLHILALTLTALSPYALAFSATAYTDGLMLLSMALALGMAGQSRWGWGGIWLGLGFACKQQALFYLPLLLALGWAVGDLTPRRVLRLFMGLAAIIVLLLLWDAARPGDSLFALAAANNDPGRLIRANEILPRLRAWLANGQALLGSGWLTALLLLNALVIMLARIAREPRQRGIMMDLILLTFVLAYGLLHWLVAFNTYDRYLLPLLPPLILLAARGIDYTINFVGARGGVPLRQTIIGLLIVALIAPATQASERRSSINIVYQQYTSINQLATYLNALPVATVIYDRWLGWELAYYLGQWHDKRLVYYPTPDLLVRDALALCEIGPRYFPAPANKPVGPWLEALRAAGFNIDQGYRDPHFVVYRMNPPWHSRQDCS